MPSYLVLGNWTDQGIHNVKDSPGRKDAARKAIEEAGGKLIFFYMTMGQYDLVALLELPDDETAARVLLTLGTIGNIRSTTLKAFTEDEFESIIDTVG